MCSERMQATSAVKSQILVAIPQTGAVTALENLRFVIRHSMCPLHESVGSRVGRREIPKLCFTLCPGIAELGSAWVFVTYVQFCLHARIRISCWVHSIQKSFRLKIDQR